ncbi:MAG: hypothetical protein HN389_11855 [Clostridia bacterium]|nr:hypothetical protein [Clostridia bacterium]MBT7931817.1 hypothetical protein [Candidatus Woesearchaeota archaeon]
MVHTFKYDNEYFALDVETGSLDKKMAKKFDDYNICNMEKYKKYRAKYYCSGGCAAANVNINGDMYEQYEKGCACKKSDLRYLSAWR